jgi:hypothetical protein
MRYGKDVTAWFRDIAPRIITPRFKTPRRYLCELALAIAKDLPYQHEEEVRAVVMRGPSPQVLSFREGALGVVPYLTVSHLPKTTARLSSSAKLWLAQVTRSNRDGRGDATRSRAWVQSGVRNPCDTVRNLVPWLAAALLDQ